MDLHDFEGQELYFDEHMSEEVAELINNASLQYGTPEAEQSLLSAFFLAPDNFSVLVALYRYYYYQHQLEKALVIANHSLRFSGQRVQFPKSWRGLTMDHVGAGAILSMSMVRFYLLALKGAGFINMRLHRFIEAEAMLAKVVELDASDRLGATPLLKFAREHLADDESQPAKAVEV